MQNVLRCWLFLWLEVGLGARRSAEPGESANRHQSQSFGHFVLSTWKLKNQKMREKNCQFKVVCIHFSFVAIA